MPPPEDPPAQLLAQHDRFLTRAQAWTSSRIAAASDDDPHKALLALLARRLAAHHAWLQRIQRGGGGGAAGPDDAVCWGAMAATREATREAPRAGSSQIVLRVAGPAPGDETVVTAGSDEAARETEEMVQQLDKMTKALARAARQTRAVAALLKARRGSGASPRPPSAGSDQARIALLRQYNDLRDVAQQLMGILADNRGVPVRSLYADGSYGVGPDD